MHPRPFRSLFLVLGLLALAPSAAAAGKEDKAAGKLLGQAMDEDYLATDFDKAGKKLQDAIKKCGASNCSPEMVGKLHAALATIYCVGQTKCDDGTAEFVLALKADPKAAPDPALVTPELTKAFKDAQKGGGPAAPPDAPEKPEKPKSKVGGDFNHTPPVEQAVNTPVPVYVEIPEDVGAEKVSIRYKPFGGNKWKTTEMRKVSKGWGGEIPCDDVTTTGDVKYFIVATDGAGEPAGTSGSMKEPYKVTIKNDIEGEAPTLPGKKAPDQCKAKEDCPPGLPGCPDAKGVAGAKHGEKGYGAACDLSEECQAGFSCTAGTCQEGGGDDKKDGDPPKKVKRNFIGLWAQLDLMAISGGQNVCNGQNASYQCFYTDAKGGQFYGAPAQQSGSNTDGIQGGFALAGGRALVSYERQLSAKAAFNLGLRLGYAFGGTPSPTAPPFRSGISEANAFQPFHGEARASYYFGGTALEKKKLHPYVFVGGGLAEADASVPVSLCDRLDRADGFAIGVAGSGATETASSHCPKGQPSTPRQLNAYQISGLGFIGFGPGITYGFTDSFGVGLELKVMVMLPTSGVVLAPTLGPIFAF